MSFAFSPSIASAFYVYHAPEDAMSMLKNSGFSHSELCFEHVEVLMERSDSTGKSPKSIGSDFAKHLKNIGISTPQGHLSFHQGLCSYGTVELLKKELDLFLAIGIKKAVIHVNGADTAQEQERIDKKVSCLSKLLDYIRGTDLTLCIENLPSNPDVRSVKSIMKFIDLLGEKNLGVCLDTGHLHLTNHRGQTNESHEEFIRYAGKHLQALHVANNDGSGDFHLEPFAIRGGVDYQKVVFALREIGYEGLFNLEIHGAVNCITSPFAVKQLKVEYIKKLIDYMLSDEFLQWDRVKL